jgi:hypothetical protein
MRVRVLALERLNGLLGSDIRTQHDVPLFIDSLHGDHNLGTTLTDCEENVDWFHRYPQKCFLPEICRSSPAIAISVLIEPGDNLLSKKQALLRKATDCFGGLFFLRIPLDDISQTRVASTSSLQQQRQTGATGMMTTCPNASGCRSE